MKCYGSRQLVISSHFCSVGGRVIQGITNLLSEFEAESFILT